ncbi:ras-related protein Rab-37-like isoform X5 [Bacillus rossius redtenbacheri]|uniref:ras-related protein Rab-37-like isoform X5 n=1 Tax=Bacillus rossius redtenbacheri TaxID=93214 RepID=UPI002FDEE2E5
MLVTEQTSSSLSVLATDDSMSDDVFEASESGLGPPALKYCRPSPTGYPDYQPPAGVLRLHERAEQEVEQMVHKNKVVTVDGSKVKLQIWDTAGQERFRSVTHAYYRDAHALLLLYDVTSKTSFDNIRAWLGEIREYAQDDVVIMLLGNKADSGAEREVHQDEGHRLAREYNVAFMETSAKTGMNVELTFMTVARRLKCHRSDNPDDTRFNVHDYVREQAQKGSCPPCAS